MIKSQSSSKLKDYVVVDVRDDDFVVRAGSDDSLSSKSGNPRGNEPGVKVFGAVSSAHTRFLNG